MAGYVIKVTIEDTHPPVWRRLVIPDRIRFSDLHDILQAAFGWLDCHLHDFEVPEFSLRVVQSEEDMDAMIYDDCEMENKILIDDYIDQCRWIRYTYDFGDDWQHKIVYEKTDPSYTLRHAQVIKWKGDNFNEDIGGVWGAAQFENGDPEEEPEFYMEPRNTFDLEEVNQILAGQEIPVRRAGKKRTPKLSSSFGQSDKELEKIFMQILKKQLIGQYGNQDQQLKKDPPRADSGIKKMIRTWNDAWDEMQEHFENGPRPVESFSSQKKITEYEQMVLPGIQREEKVPREFHTGNTVLRISTGKKTMQDNLKALGEQEIRDYCKYIRIPYKTASKTALTESFVKEIKKHPDYLRLAFRREIFGELLVLLESEKLTALPDPDAVIFAIGLGLLECKVKKSKGLKNVDLIFASDAEELVQMAEQGADAAFDDIDELNEKCSTILQPYGLLELNVFYDLCRQYADVTLSKKDFERYIYWHLRFNNAVHTFTGPQQKAYTALMDVDAERAMGIQEIYAKDLPYKKFGKEDFEKWRRGYLEVYEEWREFAGFTDSMAEDRNLSEDAADRLLYTCFCLTTNGGVVSDICRETEKVFPDMSLAESLALWEISADCVMNTAIAGLKGYSRVEAGNERVGKGAFELELPVFNSLSASCEVEKDTHIYDMPDDVQWDILFATSGEEGEVSVILKRILDEHCKDNTELLFMIALEELHEGKEKAAKKRLDQLAKQNPHIMEEIASVGGHLEDTFSPGRNPFAEEDDKIVQIPVKRETKKIYPNDPCPCGSGKKYKQCCGKKK